jgi:hypothetical protein
MARRVCEGPTALKIRPLGKNRATYSGAGTGAAILLEINGFLSLTCLISTGAP